jgi:hypothetical protein
MPSPVPPQINAGARLADGFARSPTIRLSSQATHRTGINKGLREKSSIGRREVRFLTKLVAARCAPATAESCQTLPG